MSQHILIPTDLTDRTPVSLEAARREHHDRMCAGGVNAYRATRTTL